MDFNLVNSDAGAGVDNIIGTYQYTGQGTTSDGDDFQSLSGSLMQRTQTDMTSISFSNSTGDAKNWKMWIQYPKTS